LGFAQKEHNLKMQLCCNEPHVLFLHLLQFEGNKSFWDVQIYNLTITSTKVRYALTLYAKYMLFCHLFSPYDKG